MWPYSVFFLEGIFALWYHLHWALYQEYLNIRILNNLIVLTELISTLDLPDWRIPIYIYIYICCDADQRKTRGTQKGLIENQIYSSNRNKILVNMVKQQLVGRKLRVRCGSDSPSTTQMVSHVIVSRWLVHWYLTYAPPSVRMWHKAVFKVGPVVGPLPRRIRQSQKYVGPHRHSPVTKGVPGARQLT